MRAHLGYVDMVRAWFRDAVDSDGPVLTTSLGWLFYDGPDTDLVRDVVRTLTRTRHRETAEQLGYIMKAADDRR